MKYAAKERKHGRVPFIDPYATMPCRQVYGEKEFHLIFLYSTLVDVKIIHIENTNSCFIHAMFIRVAACQKVSFFTDVVVVFYKGEDILLSV